MTPAVWRGRPVLASCLAVCSLLAAGCQSAEERARAEFSQRLKQEARLTREEIERLFAEIAPVIAGKTVEVKQGALMRALNEEERLQVLGMLTDPSGVYDGGIKVDGAKTLRALKAGGTPPYSEIDATQTLWIDVETFAPTKYDFEYSMPGFGDYSYDLTLTK